jgi:Predicted hydrolase (metallo-beta-lactamase superfamily)
VGLAVIALIVPVRRTLRTAAAWTLAVTVGAALAAGPVSDAIDRSRIPDAWAIAACAVGQGDAVLVRSAGVIALIDTGPEPEALTRCLDMLGVARVDVLVLTHFDLDHRGGIDAVRGRVGLLLHGPTGGADDDRLVREMTEFGARTVEVSRGMSGTLGDARWRALWPRAHTPPGNDASVVLEIQGGGVPAALFLGDLSETAQQGMAAGAVLPTRYDVVKVAHHGSADQDAGLYEQIHPSIALFTVGENTYGHPRAEIIELLAGLGARIARTDIHGLITLSPDTGGLRLWHARDPADVGSDR